MTCPSDPVISDVYLAESPEGLGLPLKVCLKLATNKINLDQYGDDDTSGVDIPGRYTRKSATRDFRYQKQILAQMRHPFIVKAYSHVLQEIPDCIVTEAGVCTMEGLQAVCIWVSGPREWECYAEHWTGFFRA